MSSYRGTPSGGSTEWLRRVTSYLILLIENLRLRGDLPHRQPLLGPPPAVLPLLHPPPLLGGWRRPPSPLLPPASPHSPLGLLLRGLAELRHPPDRWPSDRAGVGESFCVGLCESHLSQEISLSDARSEDARFFSLDLWQGSVTGIITDWNVSSVLTDITPRTKMLTSDNLKEEEMESFQTPSSNFRALSKKTLSSLVLDTEFYENFKIVRKLIEQFLTWAFPTVIPRERGNVREGLFNE